MPSLRTHFPSPGLHPGTRAARLDSQGISQTKQAHVPASQPPSNSGVSFIGSYSSALGLFPNRPVTRQCQGGYTNVRQQLRLPLWEKTAASPPSLIPCTYRNKMLFCDILLSVETLTLLRADLSWATDLHGTMLRVPVRQQLEHSS